MLHMLISKFNTENVEEKIEAFEKKFNFKFPQKGFFRFGRSLWV